MTKQEKATAEVNAGYYADCYVLLRSRDRLFVSAFLDRFVPVRSESADEYEVPRFSNDPTIVFKSADDLLDHLTDNPEEEHAIYWRNEAVSDIHGAMCFPTNDGCMILGLYCNTNYPDTAIEDQVFADLRTFCRSDFGYVAYEEDPPTNSNSFILRSQERNKQ